MRFIKLILNSSALTLINWLFFVLVFGWASFLKENVRWWLDLHWGSWLTDFEAMVLLRMIPAGSVWILWFLLSILFTLVWLVNRLVEFPQPQKTTVAPAPVPEETSEKIEPELHKDRVDIAETTPELKEKILRLHESLNRI